MRHGIQLRRQRRARVLGLHRCGALAGSRAVGGAIPLARSDGHGDPHGAGHGPHEQTRRHRHARANRSAQRAQYARVAGGGGRRIVVARRRIGRKDRARRFQFQRSTTVLFIDGDCFRGRNTLEYMLLDPNQIERIEALRDPASSLYGPDAIAGGVNIITRRARGDNTGAFQVAPRLVALQANSVNDLFGGRVELPGFLPGFWATGHGYAIRAQCARGEQLCEPAGRNRQQRFQSRIRGPAPGLRHERRRADGTHRRARGGRGRARRRHRRRARGPLWRLREDPLREQFLRAVSFGLRVAQAQRPLFQHLTLAEATWHYHGLFAPPADTCVPIAADGGGVLYEDR